jgi:type 1 fimbria pilin
MKYLKFILSLFMFTLMSYQAHASCSFTSSSDTITTTVTVPPLYTSSETPIGTVLWSTDTLPYSAYTDIICDTQDSWSGQYRRVTPTSLPNVYSTGIPGLGMKVMAQNTNARSYTLPFVTGSDDQVLPNHPYSEGIRWYAELVVTGPLTPGSFNTNIVDESYIKFEDLETHDLILGNVQLNVQGTACTVTTSTQDVSLGTHLTTEFTGMNSTTESVPVPLALNCPNSGIGISATLNATPDTSTTQPGAIKTTPGTGLNAGGVAIQMLDQSDNGIPLNTPVKYTSTGAGTFNFNWKARYLQTTSTPVTAGDADTSATMTITYE